MKRSISLRRNSDGENPLPIAFRNNIDLQDLKGTVLAADVGGTKANLSCFELSQGELKPLKEQSYATKDHGSFSEMIKQFQGEDLPKIDSLCLGVAGPVNNGVVRATNFPWVIDEKEIRNNLGIDSVKIINDLEANAYGLAGLEKEDFEELKKGSAISGNAAIISPGTGLGEAGLYWDGSAYHPYASEGGHCDFSPRNEFDWNLWRFFHQKYGHVSWERLISGRGIHDIYQFLVKTGEIAEPDWFKKRIANEDPAAVISSSAMKEDYPVCRQTIDLFVRFLAAEAAQLALKTKATGGIYIGGGIVPKIIQTIDRKVFYHNFVQSNRMNHLLDLVPIKVILNEKTAMYGAAFYAAMRLRN